MLKHPTLMMGKTLIVVVSVTMLTTAMCAKSPSMGAYSRQNHWMRNLRRTMKTHSHADSSMEIDSSGSVQVWRGIDRLNLAAITPPSLDEKFGSTLSISQSKLRTLACTNTSVSNEATKSSTVFADSEHECNHLSSSIEEQFNHVLKQSKENVAWTVIDRSYVDIAKDQREQLKSVGFNTVLFIAIEQDEGFARKICQDGLDVIDFRREFQTALQNKNGTAINWTLKLRVAKAKFFIPSLFQSLGVANMFTEMDLFWLQSPLAEFRTAWSGGKQPSLTFGGHANNPWGINIGMWYMQGNASVAVANLFKEAFEILRRYSTAKGADEPFTVFDQTVLQKVLAMRASIVDSLGGLPPWNEHECNTSKDLWCADLERAEIDNTVTVRLLDNYRISTSPTPEYDETVLAVHIVSYQPLSQAAFKVSMAKLFGVFQGVPQYYEQAASDSQYLAWEGLVKSADISNGYDKKHLSIPTLVPILLKLGMATHRVVILPQELDVQHQVWHSEEIFDVVKMTMLLGNSVQLRESNFLHNKRLIPQNMYPIAQISVAADTWAGMKITSAPGAAPKVSFIGLGKHSYNDWQAVTLQALVSMLEQEEVKRAKTVLLNFPLAFGNVSIGTYFNTMLDSRSCTSNITSLGTAAFERLLVCRDHIGNNAEKFATNRVVTLCNRGE